MALRPQRNHASMTDFLLGVASPEFWRNCGFALSAAGVIGIVAVIMFPEDKRHLQKGLALTFVALLLAGFGFARFGDSELLAEARERANDAEVEVARLTTPRTLAPVAQALAGALMVEGIIAGVSASAGPQMEGRPNVIVIEIGRKP